MIHERVPPYVWTNFHLPEAMYPFISLLETVFRFPMALRNAFRIFSGTAQLEDEAQAMVQQLTRDQAELRPVNRDALEDDTRPTVSYASVLSNARSAPLGLEVKTEAAKPARRAPLQELESTWRTKEGEATAARHQYFDAIESRNDEWRKNKAEVERLKEKLMAKDDEVRQAGRKIDELERTLRAVRNEQSNTKTLLDTRTAELQEAQAFLTKVDGVSDNEVLQLVERLNSNIYQTCAIITAGFESDYGKNQGGEVREQAYQRISSVGLLSPDMMNALRCFDHQQDSILVQTALQASTVSYVRWLCGTWDFHLHSTATLQSIYRRIKETGAHHNFSSGKLC